MPVIPVEAENVRSRLIPDPVRAEVKVQVQLPPDVEALVRDLHNDRQTIGAGGLVMLICTVIMTIKGLISKKD